MNWLNKPDGSMVYVRRKTLGIKIWLSPEGEDSDGETLYSIWMSGKLGIRLSLKMNGEKVVMTKFPAKLKAEEFAFDPIAIAKCHGVTTCFQSCPRCKKLQKVNVLLTTAVDEKDRLECTFCGFQF